MHTYPMLYKKSSTGKDLQWRIWVDGSTIHEEWGQIGGKLQTTYDVIKEGKNIGRANATTPQEQAKAEALSKWEKKQKAHNYTESLSAAQKGEASALVEGGILPMLAHKYYEKKAKLKFPCAAQPKLDGTRTIAQVDEHVACTLWSRTRKAVNSMPHVIKAIEDMVEAQKLDIAPIDLDGEAYSDQYSDRFEELISLIRSSKPKPNHTDIQYWIYDLAIANVEFSKRIEMLREMFKKVPAGSPLVLVETIICNNEADVEAAYNRFISEGFEGAMLRNLDGLYVGKRSVDLLKLKTSAEEEKALPDETEFKVVGVKAGRGKLRECGIFICETAEGKPFDCKRRGPIAKLKQYLKKPETAIGRWFEVQHQGWTNESKPRFCVGKRFRDDVD